MTLRNFLNKRKQRVVFNEKFSAWKNVKTQGFILGPLLFLIYINGMTEGLASNAKLCSDDTYLFSIIHDIQNSANNLNKDLERINKWATQQKMKSNLNTTKLAQGVLLDASLKKVHPPLLFNNDNVTQTSSQKHLVLGTQ